MFFPVALRISRIRPKTLRDSHIERGFNSLFYSIAKRRTLASIPPYDLLSTHRKPTYSLSCIRRYASLPSYKIITRYEDLPVDYEDGKGLSFRDTYLSQGELAAIFGRNIDSVAANQMMQVLHGRRVAGTLSILSSAAGAQTFDKQLETIALKWLRKNLPVDEIHSELQQAEQELLAAENASPELYKPNSGKNMKENGKIDLTANSYGKSGLDSIREIYEKRLDQKMNANRPAQKQVKNQSKMERLSVNTIPSRVELRRPGQNPRLIKYLELAKVLPATPPKMSIWQRLWPSILVTLGVLGASVVFVQVYMPPSSSARLWPDVPPAAATVLSLIMANIVVFAAWRFPPAFRILNKYFVNVPGYPRALAVLGSAFSHQKASHLILNMAGLWIVGTQFHEDIGRAKFLALYFSTGVLASLASLTTFTILRNFTIQSLGASGAICGITAAFLWLHSSDRFRIFRIFPPDGIPGYVCLSLLLLMDIYGACRGWNIGINIDFYAHLGGYASGIVAGEILKRKMSNRKYPERRDEGYRLVEDSEAVKTSC